jgi:23S rRNA (cytosine1962-C5)-methyltransferase
MDAGKTEMFRNRLLKNWRHLSKQARKSGVSCFRIYDHDLPEFPFCIELYGEKLYVAEYKRRHGMEDEEHEAWMVNSLETISEVININRENIFIRLRQRKQGRTGQYKKFGDAQHEFAVEENGLQFIVNLSDYLDTGLFLDHRITRKMVKEQSDGKKVLNLFSYTGSFSVYAAAGGAREVVSVDLSKTYLNWTRRNFELNGFRDESRFSIVHSDVMQYIKSIPESYYDLVILDPPTFSNSKRMDDILDLQRDHVQLIRDCLAGMRPGGLLYFSTNFRKFILDRDNIRAEIKDITRATTPFDFENKFSRFCYLIRK